MEAPKEICFYMGYWFPLQKVKNVTVKKIRQGERLHRLYFSGESFPGTCFWLERDKIPADTQASFLELRKGDTIDIRYVVTKVSVYTHAYIIDFHKREPSLFKTLVEKYQQRNVNSNTQFQALPDQEDTEVISTTSLLT